MDYLKHQKFANKQESKKNTMTTGRKINEKPVRK
jgi:hypothetical protein